MFEDLKYVQSLEKEVDDLKMDVDDLKSQIENKKVSSKVDYLLLQECLEKDILCVTYMSMLDSDNYCDMACKYLDKIKEYRTNHPIHRRLWMQKAHDGKPQIAVVYYVEGLNHNLFFVGQFCDADLEVAFKKSTCFVRDLQGNDLLTGTHGSDLYTISLPESSSQTLICFMAKASPNQTWLWHCCLSHLNFDTIYLLSKNDILNDLPKLKYVKDLLCSSCKMGKAKRRNFKTKTVPSSKRRLKLVPNVVPTADETYTSLQELELLLSPMYEEYFNEGNKSVSKSSALSDNLQQQDTQPTLNLQPTLESIIPPTNINAEENNTDQAKDSERQLATDPEMCMFALTVSKAEPNNIKEVMADHVWIEVMQEELHQFDRLNVWELVDKPLRKTVINLKWLWKNKKDETILLFAIKHDL
ncbi:integrase, catalytic region, zinc finger, CCHC-type containing protein [Tanacetum coccineum]